MKNIAKQLEQQSFGLLIVRLVLGSIFILHGTQKVFGWFGGPGLQGFLDWIGGYGVASFWAYLAAFAEFIGGCLLFLGIASEIGALLVIPVMIGAVFLIHWPHGYFVQYNGFEYPFNLILFALAIIIGGPGKYYLWDPFSNFRDNL